MFKMEKDNSSRSNRFTCRYCNIAGTESCHKACICKSWYDGDFCQNCRFTNEFVLAANGTCIPCPCGGRPIHECFQSKICTTHANVAFKEAKAASALFIATLVAVVLVGMYLVFRIIKRTKRLRSIACRRTYQDDDYGDESDGGVTDDDGALIWKDDEQLVNNDENRRHLLLTPVSDRSSTNTSLFYIPSPTPTIRPIPGSKSVSSYLTSLQKGASTRGNGCNWKIDSTPTVLNVDNAGGDGFDDFPKSAMKISSSCSEYYFLSVQANDEEEEEHEI